MKVRISKKTFWTAILLILSGAFLAANNLLAYIKAEQLFMDMTLLGAIASGIMAATALVISLMPETHHGHSEE